MSHLTLVNIIFKILNLFLGVQARLCSILLSFQPIWLRLALETIFETEINFFQNSEVKFNYLRTMSSFILHNVLADFSIVSKSKKYVIGQQKYFFIKKLKFFLIYRRLLTPAGVDIMQKNFLSIFLTILYLIESFVTENFVPSIPCMFWPSSPYKVISSNYLQFLIYI